MSTKSVMKDGKTLIVGGAFLAGGALIGVAGQALASRVSPNTMVATAAGVVVPAVVGFGIIKGNMGKMIALGGVAPIALAVVNKVRGA